MRRSVRLLLVLAVTVAAPACRSADPYALDQVRPDGATLVVRNDNFADMDLYAVSSGLATRIGTVSGLSTQSFALSSTMIGGSDFRVVATPIGGNGRASTGALLVRGGSVIDFRIASVLNQSVGSVR